MTPARCPTCGGPLFRLGRKLRIDAAGEVIDHGYIVSVDVGDCIDCEQPWDSGNGCRLCGLDQWASLDVAEDDLFARVIDIPIRPLWLDGPAVANDTANSAATSIADPHRPMGAVGNHEDFALAWEAMRGPHRGLDEDRYAIHGHCWRGQHRQQQARRDRGEDLDEMRQMDFWERARRLRNAANREANR